MSTNSMSTHEKELMMEKASNEKKEMRFNQKLRHSEQREAEKEKRRKGDLLSNIIRSDAAQLLTEDSKAALRHVSQAGKRSMIVPDGTVRRLLEANNQCPTRAQPFV
eukprot:jgi/Tetstr1/456974/TSEL_004159.t1